jgi:glycosyltransferase involved in cell wall biosynthesis
MRIYITGLVAAMASIDPASEFVVFESRYIDLHELNGIPNVRRRRCFGVPRHRSARVIYQNTMYPALLKAAKLDTFLATANVLPLWLDTPAIVVIQGLQWFSRPEAFGRLRGLYLRAAAKNAARRAKHLVAVSSTTRNDAALYFAVPEQTIDVIHHGISGPIQQWAHLRNRGSRPPTPYILNVATLYHHKNQLRLIEAFAAMRARYGLKHRLRIIGGDSDLTREDLRLHAKKAGVEDFIDLLGPVDHSQLGPHYANADLFVYPSLYETFGHPPLEAMVADCPVIASNSSAMPEIVGDAALLVDPTDVEAIADAMGSALTDAGLRASLISKGAKRIKEFSWNRAATSYLDLLERTRSTKWPLRTN